MASRHLDTLHPSQEAERAKCWCSTCFSLFFHPSPSTGNRGSHMWAALPTSKNLIYRCLTDRTRRFVATLILNPIKLTIEMNPPCHLWKVFRRLASMPLCVLPVHLSSSIRSHLCICRSSFVPHCDVCIKNS